MPIQYKLSDVAVCLVGSCLQKSFLFSKDVAQLAIPGSPFLSLLYLFQVNQNDLISKGGHIRLNFSTKPEIRNPVEKQFLYTLTKKSRSGINPETSPGGTTYSLAERSLKEKF